MLADAPGVQAAVGAGRTVEVGEASGPEHVGSQGAVGVAALAKQRGTRWWNTRREAPPSFYRLENGPRRPTGNRCGVKRTRRPRRVPGHHSRIHRTADTCTRSTDTERTVTEAGRRALTHEQHTLWSDHPTGHQQRPRPRTQPLSGGGGFFVGACCAGVRAHSQTPPTDRRRAGIQRPTASAQ